MFGFDAAYGDKVEFSNDLNETLNFDYNLGIVDQLFWSKNLTFEDYYQYINEPKHLINPVRDLRMFTSDFIEVFSKTNWYVIPFAYIPMNYWLI